VNNGGSLVLINCIIDTVSGNGVTFSSSVAQLISINCDYYNTGGDAIKFASTNPAGFNVIMNNNFSRIGGRVINNSVGASVGGPGSESGIIYNNGRGTDINVTDQRKSIIETSTDIFYPLGVTPWNSPDSGDFSKVLAAAIGSGRGAFTETDGTNTGTASFPDIGAAQANAITQSPAWAGGDFILPLGYVSRSYPKYQWAFTVGTSFSLVSGSLPPGLTLNTISTTTASIVGTPTALGTYAFVLRATVGTSTGDATFHITISADPDEGIGGLLGGLRPTC
jgi:hypothetical protein